MFENREEAARKLAVKLGNRVDDFIILGIVRGGLVFAKIIAQTLSVPKIAIAAKKIVHSQNPELALGAITLEDTIVIDRRLVKIYNLSQTKLSEIIKAKKKELIKTISVLNLPKVLNLKGKSVVITDDGIATGATIECVIKYCRLKKAAKVIVAVPVASSDIYDKISKTVDSLLVLKKPRMFNSVGQFYKDFKQVDDAYAKKLIV